MKMIRPLTPEVIAARIDASRNSASSLPRPRSSARVSVCHSASRRSAFLNGPRKARCSACAGGPSRPDRSRSRTSRRRQSRMVMRISDEGASRRSMPATCGVCGHLADALSRLGVTGAGACAVPARGRPPAVSSAASPISRPGPSPAIPAWRKCAWSAGSNRNPTRALIARQRFTRIKNAKHSLASSTSWRVLLFTATTGGHEGRAKSRHSRRYLRRLSS